MKSIIVWKDIDEISPKEGQEILYSYTYEYEPNKYERRTKIDIYTHSEMQKFPMCYMTFWAEVPDPLTYSSEVD